MDYVKINVYESTTPGAAIGHWLAGAAHWLAGPYGVIAAAVVFVALVSGPGIVGRITARLDSLTTHVSVVGTLTDVSPSEPGSVALVLSPASVAHSSGAKGTMGLNLEQVETYSLRIPYVSEAVALCHQWASEGEEVRVELIRSRTRVEFFSITDRNQLGVVQARPHYIFRGQQLN